MKKTLIGLFSLLCLIGYGQTQQHINKKFSTESNLISDIDSIRFNPDTDEMEVILKSKEIKKHDISTIKNVTFGSAEATCGASNVLNPVLSYGSMTDQEGNSYKTIKIGSQEWMAENLKTKTYSNGDPVNNVKDSSEWVDAVAGAWCDYDNQVSFECPYGKLYNWYAVNDSRNLCPAGWHVPSNSEWSTLINLLDPNADGGLKTPNFAGGGLKSAGLQYWIFPNSSATNHTGFSALPGGYRVNFFAGINLLGYWWSSSEQSATTGWLRYLNLNSATITASNNAKWLGISVRCIKDL